MANDKPNFKGVPGIPLHALDAIKDENARLVMRAVVDGWHLRNGSSGDGDNRFITKAEVGDFVNRSGGYGLGGGTGQQLRQPNSSGIKPGQVAGLIDALQQSVLESRLFKELGERIDLIDKPGGIFDRLDDIGALIETEQQVRADADTAQITNINNLLVRTANAEASIVNEQNARINGDNALLSSFNALGIRVGQNEAGLVTETNARVNADNAIISTTTTQFSQVNSSLSLVQNRVDTLSNNVSAVASQVSQVQVQLGNQSVAIQQESTARLNADNDIYAKFTVKIDNNGYVTGFGLASSSNNSTPFSEFIVRADRFAIGSPSGPGITPIVPFIVTTTGGTIGGQYVPPGVYMSTAFIANGTIGNAKIGNAEIDTLKLGGETVTVPRYGTAAIAQALTTSYGSDFATVTFIVGGIGAGESVRILASGVVQAYPSDGTSTNLVLGLFINGSLITQIGATFDEKGISVCIVGSALVGAGAYTVSLRVRCDPTPSGASSKPTSNFVGNLIVTTAKR
jgi:hypothetical protein